MTVKFIRDVTFSDQDGCKVKIKKGKILSAKINEDNEYEIKHKKDIFVLSKHMKDVVFKIL